MAQATRERLRLSVRDNGRGFDVATRNGTGMGLRSMRERVEALGGTLRIATRPEGGTLVEAVVPIRIENAELRM